MIAVGIIEDDPTIREAMKDFLNSQEGMECDVDTPTVEAFLHFVPPDNHPNVVLCDIGLPGMSGITGIRFLKERYPAMDVVMLTVHDDPEKIFESLCAGATGYLLKNTPFHQIKEGIETACSGGAPMSPEIAVKVVAFFRKNPKNASFSPLTAKEKEVVVGLVDGLSYKMIAERMSISLQTVQVHIKNIYRKLHAHSKGEVIAKSLRGEI